ncbi:MAG TPA: hypothetical protein PLB75_07620 [Paludibacteraceae bacterium]|jgi:hypothetical protein|nr:hypothetical protein [Paludibacteraceae bacterium]
MTNIYVRKTDFGWQWNETLHNGYVWHSMPTTIKTHSDMIAFFRSGGHRGTRGGNFDTPQLTLVDQDNKVLRHYNVRIDNASGLHSAVVDYDDNKRKVFTTAQLWNEADQLAYLRQSAVHLPEEYDSVKSALAYLANEEPFTVEEYHAALKQKLTDTITAECQAHAAGTPAVVEFTD